MVHLNLDYCKYKIRGARYGKQKEETLILILGAVGVKVPDALQDLFNVQPQTTTLKHTSTKRR